MKKYIIAITAFVALNLHAQKVKTDMVSMWCTFMPKTILPQDNLTFSCVTIASPANDPYKSTSTMESSGWNSNMVKLITGFRNVGAAQNPAVAITIRTEPFSITQTKLVQGTAPTVNFSYDMYAQYVLKAVAVLSNGDTVLSIVRNQGALTQMNFPYSVKTNATPATFATQAQLDGDYRKNKNDVWTMAKAKCDKEFITFLTDTLNVMFGYPSDKLFFEIATAKSKSFQYNDLDSAKMFIEQAMDSVTAHTRANDTRNWSFESSRVLVHKAIIIWEKALTEESADKKARIHPELAGYIRLNLALAYMMLDDYAKADELYAKCYADKELGNGTQRNIDYIRKKYLPVFKARYEIHKPRL